jgi:hypothetical protein
MDARRAFEVLGLSTPTSEEGVRRAYLKAVRAHGPERDPAGFAEVRSAYELLSRRHWLPMLTASAVEAEPVAPESTRAPAEPQSPSSSRVGVPSSPPARQSAAPPPLAAPADGFLRLLAASNPAGAAQLLLGAWADGHGLVAPPAHVLSCTLQLFEAGALGLAVELLLAFEASTERAEFRPSTFDTAVIARWMLLTELAALPGHAERELIAALATAVRSGRYRHARRVLARAVAANASLMPRLRRLAPALLAATRRPRSAERDSLRPTRYAPVVAR